MKVTLAEKVWDRVSAFYEDAIKVLSTDIQDLLEPVDSLLPSKDDEDTLPNNEEFLNVFDKALLSKLLAGIVNVVWGASLSSPIHAFSAHRTLHP